MIKISAEFIRQRFFIFTPMNYTRMQKSILTLCAYCCVLSIFSQNIPNGNFESWTPVMYPGDTLVGIEPDANGGTFQQYWNSLNGVVLQGLPYTCFQDSLTPHGGNYAVKLVTEDLNFFTTALLMNITNDPNNQLSLFLGKPYSQRPVSLDGYYKYAPVNGDSALIWVRFSHYDAINHTRIYNGEGKMKITNILPSYQFISTPIVYTDSLFPDTVSFIFSSSADIGPYPIFLGSDGQIGSTFYIDDIEFAFNTVSNENENAPFPFTLYPNPATEFLQVKNLPAEAYSWKIFSVQGTLVSSGYNHQSEIQIPLATLNRGLYFLEVSSETQPVPVRTRFLKE